jgi:hypothetical protein
MSRLERLNERYYQHHGRRQEFVFGADDRSKRQRASGSTVFSARKPE